MKPQDVVVGLSIGLIVGAVARQLAKPSLETETAVLIEGPTATNVIVITNFVTNIEYSVIVVGDKRQPTNKPIIQPTAEIEPEPDRIVRELIAEGMTRDEAVLTYNRWMEWASHKRRQTQLDDMILPGILTNEPNRGRFPLFEAP